MCLAFVRAAFSISPVYAYAWQSWANSKFQHTDPLPQDVAVAVFYTWYGTIDGVTRNWGDIAIHVPGRGVFGSPTRGLKNTNRWDPSVEARRAAIGGQAKYVGWTEDVNGVRIVENVVTPTKPQGGDEMIANTDQAQKAYKLLRPNGAGSAGEIAATAGKRTFAEFLNSAQPEVAARDKSLREQKTYIEALQNDLNTMKRQADELAKRPTQAAFTELHTNLTICAEGASKQLALIDQLEAEKVTLQTELEANSLGKIVRQILTGAVRVFRLDKIVEAIRK